MSIDYNKQFSCTIMDSYSELHSGSA